MVAITIKEICVCPRPSIAENFQEWAQWVQTHWRECKPKKIENIYLPGDADDK